MIIKSLQIFEKDPEVIVEKINDLIRAIDRVRHDGVIIDEDLDGVEHEVSRLRKRIEELEK